MSVTDPLLKRLKGFIVGLRTDPNPICDHHKILQPFCETLEHIFRKGIKESTSIFGNTKRDYWHWIETIGNGSKTGCRVNPIFDLAVDAIKKSKKITSAQGRGRAFIRMALQKKILCVPIEILMKNQALSNTIYEPVGSILGDEILTEILMSQLFEVTEINFRLTTRNVAFLDETWIIPVYKEFEFVPCLDLGIQVQLIMYQYIVFVCYDISHMNGRVLVASLDDGGIADEDNKVEPGDVLDELLKESLRNIMKGKIPKILRQNQGFPVYLSVIKCKMPDGTIFPPILHLLRALGPDFPMLLQVVREDDRRQKEAAKRARQPPHALLPEDEAEEVPVHSADGRAQYCLRYIAKMIIGQDGGVHQIEGAIGRVLDTVKPQHNPQETQAVLFETGETDVIVKDAKTGEAMFTHSYTKISSCGRRVDSTLYFAYIAGETTCTIAKQFVAYVFKANSDEEAKTILCSIAQGFGRTHWYV